MTIERHFLRLRVAQPEFLGYEPATVPPARRSDGGVRSMRGRQLQRKRVPGKPRLAGQWSFKWLFRREKPPR